MSDLRRLLGFVRPYSAVLALSILLMACSGAGQAVTALLIGPVFDRVLTPGPETGPIVLFTVPVLNRPITLQQLSPFPIQDAWLLVAGAILAAFLVKGLADYLGNLLINRVGLSVVTDVRQTVYEHVLRQDANFYEGHATGRLMSSIMGDLDKIQVATSHILADALRQGFAVLALLYVVLQHDWRLALFSLTVLPIVLVPTIRLGRRIRRTTRSAQDEQADLNAVLQETLSGQQVIKAFAAEPQEARRFRHIAERLRAANLRYVAQQAIASPLIEFFGAVTVVALLTYARYQIELGRMTTGQFTSFVIALLLLYEPVKRLAGIHNIFQQALGASQRVFEYLDRVPLIQDGPQSRPMPPFRESVEFSRVTFQYPNTPGALALRDVSLRVEAGEVLALVGPSGAGKSTLASLVPRFQDATDGRVRIDGSDVRDLQLATLRAQVGVVSQDTFLFNDTVANNIRYGNPQAGDGQVAAAARAALADEFILRLPAGYNTMVGERGAKLSGGQRQRLAIARALLKNAPILILDEATSHLDAASEALVQDALANLMRGRTVIVIAHRLSTVRRADKIVVMDRGRVSEVGTHDELVGQGGIYQRLHELQFLDVDGTMVNP